ncbi:MAG TPA: lasso peptide biosynthesis B2 protein [Trueperaceae bacterium]
MASASLTAASPHRRADRAAPGRIARFVTTGTASAADVGVLVSAGLASVARRRLAHAGLADDPRLVRGAQAARARHAATRAQVVPLLAAWRAAGAEVLLFKGFYLAELVHEDPADRPYDDVDVLLRAPGVEDEDLAARLAAAAEGCGWEVAWRLGAADHLDRPGVAFERHELLRVRHPKLRVVVDAHRHLVHGGVAVVGERKRLRITQAVWAASRPAVVGGVPVRVPSFVDSALVGLVTSRSWSDDAHALRPHDYLDLEALMRAGGFGPAELLRRARELGAAATLRTFLGRCDPTRGVLDLAEPSPLRAFLLDLSVLPERAPHALERLVELALGLPSDLRALAGALPVVSRAVRSWRAGRPVAVPEGPLAPGGSPPDARAWWLVTLGVRRAMQLHGLRSEEHPALTLAAVAEVARARGLDVRLVNDGRHAWFAHGDEVLRLAGLGLPRGARRHRWPLATTAPRAPLLARLWRLGPRGLALRLEALSYVRRARRLLEEKTFALARQELAAGRRLTRMSGAPPAEVGRAVESAARFVPGARCVARSLAAQAMLARRGVPSRVHFGFRRLPDGTVDGHAWVEVGGAVVAGDVGLDDFTRTATFDA